MTMVFVLIFLFCGLSFFFLAQVFQSSTKGYEVSSLEDKAEELREQNKKLEVQAAELRSLNGLEESVKEINMVLNELTGMAEISDSEMLQFAAIRETLTEYLEYIPSVWPTESTYIGSYFGMRWHPVLEVLKEHTGADLGGAYGDDIYAAASGTVTMSRYNSGYGYMVRIDHGEGIETYYGHASKLLVKQGEEVEKGQVIALVGSSGISTGPHLHFEIRIDDVPVDPLPFINGGE